MAFSATACGGIGEIKHIHSSVDKGGRIKTDDSMGSEIFAAACGGIGEKKHIRRYNDKGGEQKPMTAWGMSIKFLRLPAAA